MYELTGTERKEEIRSKAPCGNIVTTNYYVGDILVRTDQDVQVDAAFISKAFARKIGE